MEVFHSFFGNETKKELELLKLLYKNKRFMGTEEISECLKMDRRSVYKYYDLLLNKPYMTKKEHMAVLSVKHGQGYKFNGSKKTIRFYQDKSFNRILFLNCLRLSYLIIRSSSQNSPMIILFLNQVFEKNA